MLLRIAERFHVSPARGKRALPQVAEPGQFADVRAQQVDAVTCASREHHDRPLTRSNPGTVAGEIDFVAHNGDGDAVRHRLLDALRHRFGGILDPEYCVGLSHRLSRPANALGLDAVRVLAQARGVDELDGQAVDIDALAQYVPGCTGDLGHDRRFLARQAVHEAGLARIGFADDHDLVAVAHHAPDGRPGQQRPECRLAGCKPFAEFVVCQEVDLFLGEVDGRLDVHADGRELLGKLVDGFGKSAAQRAQRGSRRLLGTAVDQVGDGLRLREIELVIQECTLGELPGLCPPCAQGKRRIHQQGHDDRPAVAVQLDDRFAGERRGTSKIQGQPLVQRLAPCVQEGRVGGDSRFR